MLEKKIKKTLFTIAWPFWTNIEYSHRVPTLIFVEIIVWELIDTSQWRNTKIFLYAQARQFPPQQGENYNWNHLTFLNKIYSFMNDWVSFSVEILKQFQTVGYGSIKSTSRLPGILTQCKIKTLLNWIAVVSDQQCMTFRPEMWNEFP